MQSASSSKEGLSWWSSVSAVVPPWRGAMSSAVTGNDVVVQTKLPQKHKAAQVSGCRECQSLAPELDDSRDNSCVKCSQADDVLIMVAALREEVERLRSIRDAEEEIGWWSHSAPSLWQMNQLAASQGVEDPLLSHHTRQKKGTSDMGWGEEWK